jgi:hypothetical protein
MMVKAGYAMIALAHMVATKRCSSRWSILPVPAFVGTQDRGNKTAEKI